MVLFDAAGMGGCGKVTILGESTRAFVEFAPATLFPRLEGFAAGSVSDDAAYLSYCYAVPGSRVGASAPSSCARWRAISSAADIGRSRPSGSRLGRQLGPARPVPRGERLHCAEGGRSVPAAAVGSSRRTRAGRGPRSGRGGPFPTVSTRGVDPNETADVIWGGQTSLWRDGCSRGSRYFVFHRWHRGGGIPPNQTLDICRSRSR